MTRSIRLVLAAALMVMATAFVAGSSAAPASAVPGPLNHVGHVYQPTDAVVLPDGRLLVLEKQGILKLFPTVTDQLPIRLLDLTTEVWSFRDFGAMALAVSPQFVTDHTIYMLYDRDAFPVPGSASPQWGKPTVTDDVCPHDADPGCTIGARLISMQLTPDNRIENIKTVLESGPTAGWCFQFDGHGVDDLLFDKEGALLISAGDGARSDAGDTGVKEVNTGCGAYFGDEKTTEGGALRALDVLTPSAYTSFNGAILRIDPHTGAAWPDNALVGGATASDDRVVAIGFRNPFRMSLDDKTGLIWVGDVGADRGEEIDVVDTAKFTKTVQNFRWPCEEGKQPSQDKVILDSPLCGTTTAVPNEIGHNALTYAQLPQRWCEQGSLATIGGDVFTRANGSRWYIFGDWVGQCILALPVSADNSLDLAKAEPLLGRGIGPTRFRNLDGELMVVDIAGGAVEVYGESVIEPPPVHHIGIWVGRVVVGLVLAGLLSVVLVRKRAVRIRRARQLSLTGGAGEVDTSGYGALGSEPPSTESGPTGG